MVAHAAKPSHAPESAQLLVSDEGNCNSRPPIQQQANHLPQFHHSFAQLLDPDEGTDLKYIPSSNINGICCAKINKLDVLDEIAYWQSAVLCTVMGANPLFEIMKAFFNRPFPNHGDFFNEEGVLIRQQVTYEWVPSKCTHCAMLGHTEEVCKKKKVVVRTEWRKKTQPSLLTSSVAGQPAPSTTPSPPQLEASTSLEPPPQDFTLASKGTAPKRLSVTPVAPLSELHNNVKLFLQLNDVGLVGLIETKIWQHNAVSLASNFLRGWQWANNCDISNGRIWVAWKPCSYHIAILEKTDQYIHCCATQLTTRKHFHITFIYSHNHELQKATSMDCAASSLPIHTRRVVHPRGFQYYLCKNCLAQELSSRGQTKPSEASSVEYSSTTCGMKSLTSRWPKSSPLDYPITPLSSFSSTYPQGHRPIFSSATCGARTGISILLFRRASLTLLNRVHFKDLKIQQELARNALLQLQQALQCSHDNAALKHLENEARANYISILSSSLALLRQQCKMDWISYWDDSTWFFFAKAKQRKLTTYIYSIHDASDNEVEGFDLVGDVLFSYYRDHLGKASMRRAHLDPATIAQGATLSMEQQLELCMLFSDNDIKEAMFDIPNHKSPSSDGFSSGSDPHLSYEEPLFRRPWNVQLLGIHVPPPSKFNIGYKWLMGGTKVSWDRVIWARASIPRHAFIAWVYVQHRMPSKMRPNRFVHQSDLQCSLCSGGAEDDTHLFSACPYAREVWDSIVLWWPLPIRSTVYSHEDMIASMIRSKAPKAQKQISCAIFAATIYFTWYARNHLLLKKHHVPAQQTVCMMKFHIRQRILFLNSLNCTF
ncbi:hypothetical protein Cgig2_010914 [Carnegiea gigantea]|uniref:Reverse transcriptase zinc-binding domain-containing protein n=1 Tax=Carnegiea gigantea TaxID=171969 RepID=A0A9Q1GG39_9CARY|nr:hypothetical protein Cgig2_010914 [Carnegiea gigantea]